MLRCQHNFLIKEVAKTFAWIPTTRNPHRYAEIHHHRLVPQTPIEENEIGPTIQQGVIQRPVRNLQVQEQEDQWLL